LNRRHCVGEFAPVAWQRRAHYRSTAPVVSAIKSGYGFGVLDPSAWRSGHHWRSFVRQKNRVAVADSTP